MAKKKSKKSKDKFEDIAALDIAYSAINWAPTPEALKKMEQSNIERAQKEKVKAVQSFYELIPVLTQLKALLMHVCPPVPAEPVLQPVSRPEHTHHEDVKDQLTSVEIQRGQTHVKLNFR